MTLRYGLLFIVVLFAGLLSACVLEEQTPTRSGDAAPGAPSETAPAPDEPPVSEQEPSEPLEDIVIDDIDDQSSEGMSPSRTDEPSRTLETASKLEVVTDFLRPGQAFEAKADKLPVGVLLLSADDDMKSAILCDAFTKDLRTYAEAKAESPEKDFFVTYWLLKEQPASTTSCDDLRSAYDFERAKLIKAQHGLQSVTGPVFLAIDANGDSVFLDLSEAGLDATREAVSQWLTLALEASQSSDEPDVLSDIADNAPKTASGRYALGGFSLKMKTRLMNDGTTQPLTNAYGGGDGGVQLFAYADTQTGYRIGSTIRF